MIRFSGYATNAVTANTDTQLSLTYESGCSVLDIKPVAELYMPTFKSDYFNALVAITVTLNSVVYFRNGGAFVVNDLVRGVVTYI